LELFSLSMACGFACLPACVQDLDGQNSVISYIVKDYLVYLCGTGDRFVREKPQIQEINGRAILDFHGSCLQ